MKNFVFPPSVQAELFNYLKPAQQETLKPILRILKKPAQEELCTALLDYLEGHGIQHIDDFLLDKLQASIIDICEIHPLTSRKPHPIGDILKGMFPLFNRTSLNPQL